MVQYLGKTDTDLILIEETKNELERIRLASTLIGNGSVSYSISKDEKIPEGFEVVEVYETIKRFRIMSKNKADIYLHPSGKIIAVFPCTEKAS